MRPDDDAVAPEGASLPMDWKRIATSAARAALIGATLIDIAADNGEPELILSWRSLTRAFRLSELDPAEHVLTELSAPA